jgi:hypothetical protein
MQTTAAPMKSGRRYYLVLFKADLRAKPSLAIAQL